MLTKSDKKRSFCMSVAQWADEQVKRTEITDSLPSLRIRELTEGVDHWVGIYNSILHAQGRASNTEVLAMHRFGQSLL